MGLPRTFVGFSSSDVHYYRLMLAWKANEHIDFDFANCQLSGELYSEDEAYIKRKCRGRIELAGTYIMLIGDDTRSKHKYVRWEAEVAIEKDCRIIGVNLNRTRGVDSVRCPPIVRGIGAIFLPFSPRVIAYALEHFRMHDAGDWDYKDDIYSKLGYEV